MFSRKRSRRDLRRAGSATDLQELPAEFPRSGTRNASYAASAKFSSALEIMVGFLRGLLTNHGTQPLLQAIRSIPIRPRNFFSFSLDRSRHKPCPLRCFRRRRVTHSIGLFAEVNQHGQDGGRPNDDSRRAEACPDIGRTAGFVSNRSFGTVSGGKTACEAPFPPP